jgi:hypothetical protein
LAVAMATACMNKDQHVCLQLQTAAIAKNKTLTEATANSTSLRTIRRFSGSAWVAF